MSKITRREFLEQVAFGSSAIGASMVLKIHPLLQLAEKEEETIFLEGTVSRVKGDRLIVKDESVIYTLFMTNKTRIWKGKVASLDQVDIGDYIYARGIPKAEEEFIATKVWVNIANFYGTVVDREGNTLSLRIDDPRFETFLTVHITADTLVNEARGVDLSVLSPGRYVQALGLYQRDGSLLATRLFYSTERLAS